LELLADASTLLCEDLNRGEGVKKDAIFTAQRKLCRFSPVFKVLAEAFALCGTFEDVEREFYDALEPSFTGSILFEFSQIRDKRKRAREHKGKVRQYNFQVENCRPVHDKDYVTEMDEDEDLVTVTGGTKTIKGEAV